MAVLTLSRQFGAGALLLGERLCEKTGFHLVDEQTIHDLAEKDNVSRDWLTGIEKESASNTLYVLSNMISKGFFYKTPGIPSDEVERKKYVDLLKRIMTGMADRGGFVIVGRGSQFILKDHPRVIHLLLIGERESRIRRVSEDFHIPPSQAQELIRAREKARAHLAENIFGKNIDDPFHYHLVINTDKLKLDWAVEAVATLIKRELEKERDEA